MGEARRLTLRGEALIQRTASRLLPSTMRDSSPRSAPARRPSPPNRAASAGEGAGSGAPVPSTSGSVSDIRRNSTSASSSTVSSSW
jgi:hypothetical protein